jgi:hypothetical protein
MDRPVRASFRVALCIAAALAAASSLRASEALVDPTRPAPTGPAREQPPPEAGGVRLQAIVSRPGSLVAIVNGRIVRTGDRFANMFIEEVTPEGVRYVQGGRSGFARLPHAALPVRSAPARK